MGCPRENAWRSRGFFFLSTIDLRISDDIESVWEEEITDRVRAVDAGTAIGLDYDTAMGEIEKRFAS